MLSRLSAEGFVAGYVSSAFTLGQALSSYGAGWAADRFGRVAVMVWSMSVIAVSSVVFGMSTSLPMAITTRCESPSDDCLGWLAGPGDGAAPAVTGATGGDERPRRAGCVCWPDGGRAVACFDG